MTDRKTVMSWLEGLAQEDWRMFHSDSEVQQIAMAALEVLKEQEMDKRIKYKPISYYHGLDRPFSYRCWNCFHSLKEGDHFCSGCGKEIDWE